MLFTVTRIAGKLLLRKLYKNGIFADTFDLMPRNYQVLFPAKTKKAAGSVNDQSKDPGVLTVKFKIGRISKPCSVA